MERFPALPRGLYSDERDGLGDPQRWTPDDRMRRSETALAEEAARDDATILSPALRELNRVSRQAVRR
jgi:hypothetical protein